jgi:hypothetical protein
MSKLHIVFDRPESIWHDEDTGNLKVRKVTVVTDTGTFTEGVMLTRFAMEQHGTDAKRLMAALPLSKFGFTVDGDWDDDRGIWIIHGITGALRNGVLPPECRVKEILQTLREARGLNGATVLGNDTIDDVIALLLDRKA